MTVYFINEAINLQNSGIEHAEFDRADLFRKHHVDFKIITSVFAPHLHSILPHFNIRDTESVNLFDYFQDALSLPPKGVKIDEVDFGLDVNLTKSPKNPKLLEARAQINSNFFLGRVMLLDEEEETIDHLEYFDTCGNLYKAEYYDDRGFKSLVQYFDPSGRLEAENWLKPNGEPAIIKTYALLRNKTLETWRVGNRVFSSLDDLRLYFYNCLNSSGDNIFIPDRSNVSDWQLTKLTRPAYLAFPLHNCHTASAENPNEPLLNDNYEWDLSNVDKWDCIISATPKQTHDVKERFGNGKTKFFTIPVGVVKNETLHADVPKMNERKPHSLLVTARVAPEKGIDKMIQAIRLAQKTIPDLTLDVYGYVDHSNNDALLKEINKQRSLLDNPDSVVLHPHAEDVGELQKTHQVYLIFSRMEGFNLALMEAQSHGMAAVVNNVNYGSNDLVIDGVNGYIAPYNDVQEYAKKIVKIFEDDDRLQTMQDEALGWSERYSEPVVWRAWKQVFDDAKRKFASLETSF